MSAFERAKLDFASQQMGRVMSMLALVEAGLRQEMKFQDEHVTRPINVEEFIPELGEIVDALAICQSELRHCLDQMAVGS